jgi:predicted permease
MRNLHQDLVYALRMLRKNPGFTLVAVLCFALGVGANTAMFSLADALLLRPLAVKDAANLLVIRGNAPDNPYLGLSYRDYADLRDKNKSFDGVTGFAVSRIGFAANPSAPAQTKMALYVTDGFFETLGVAPGLGRAFSPEENKVPGRDAVAVLSHGFFGEQFHSDPSVLGSRIRLNGVDFTVIGVAPESFQGVDQYFKPSIIIPYMMYGRLTGAVGSDFVEKRDFRYLDVRGRIRQGVSPATAQAELASIGQNLQQAYPATNRGYGFLLRSEFKNRVDRSPPDAMMVALLLGLATLVLAIACANLANLLLSRSRARSREMAMRLAVGASRGRLIRQLLTESLVISLLGGLAGLLVGRIGVDYLAGIEIPADPPFSLSLQLDMRVLFYALAVSVVGAVIFGLVPALQTTRTDLALAMKSGDAEVGRRSRLLGRNLLVAGQVALSLVLLVSAATLMQRFTGLINAGPGFRNDHLMMVSVDPKLVRYAPEQSRQFYRQLEEQARTLPGVRNVALSSTVPLGMEVNTTTLAPEGYELPKGREWLTSLSANVSKDYYRTLDIPIVEGRAFTENDNGNAPPVAVVNEVFAAKYFPGGSAVGRRIKVADDGVKWFQIVGVARNSKYVWIAENPTAFVYFPVEQRNPSRMTLMAQSSGDPKDLAGPMRNLVHTLDADMPVFEVRTMERFYHARAVGIPSALSTVISSMGVMGLLLALVGLYGLIAYSVSRETRSIGIRMAIGARSNDVLRMVLRRGLLLSLTGVAFGAVASLGVRRVLQAAFGNVSGDFTAFAVMTGALLLTAMLATLIPALRASRIDPIKALRYE